MNPEKLKKLQESVRIGGKGTPRRKKKIVHATAATDDKKLQSLLKKLAVNVIPGIEEVNMIKNDGTVIHFNNPKAQASLAANTFAITGHGETVQVSVPWPSMMFYGGIPCRYAQCLISKHGVLLSHLTDGRTQRGL